jgi:Ca-activated chloride channel family protein
VLLLVGVALFLVGFARPMATVTVDRQEATLIVVLDVSGSMAAKDVPPSRLAAAKTAIRSLVESTPSSYRVALLSFSDHSAFVSPPTTDRRVFLAALDRLRTGPQGTALAQAVARAVTLASSLPPVQGKRPPATILVVSDGGQTSGRITPQQAGALARRAGVPISAVSVGTQGGVVRQTLPGGYVEQFAVPVQPQSLQQLTRASGGRLYTSVRDESVSTVVRELGSRLGHQRKTVDVSSAAAAGGLVFMLVGGLLSGIWLRRVV